MARTCPDGHLSQAEDYCDVCGLALADNAGGGSDGADGSDGDATSPDLTPVRPTSQECPNCSAENAPDALFCEACGYDYTTGTMPRPVEPAFPLPMSMRSGGPMPSDKHVHGEGSGDGTPDEGADAEDTGTDADAGTDGGTDADGEGDGDTAGVAASTPVAPAPSAPAASTPAPSAPALGDRSADANPAPALDEPWVAEVWIDPDWYADQGSTERMPSPGLPTVIVLRHTSSLIGRASRSRGIAPDIDISGDPGVSRRHAQLTTDGSRWFLEDLGSANGTYLAAATGSLPTEPVSEGRKQEIAPGEQVYLGAWTRIVIRKAAQGEV